MRALNGAGLAVAPRVGVGSLGGVIAGIKVKLHATVVDAAQQMLWLEDVLQMSNAWMQNHDRIQKDTKGINCFRLAKTNAGNMATEM